VDGIMGKRSKHGAERPPACLVLNPPPPPPRGAFPPKTKNIAGQEFSYLYGLYSFIYPIRSNNSPHIKYIKYTVPQKIYYYTRIIAFTYCEAIGICGKSDREEEIVALPLVRTLKVVITSSMPLQPWAISFLNVVLVSASRRT